MTTTLTFRGIDVLVFTTDEALARGHSRRDIARFVRAKEWRRIIGGVYATIPEASLYPEELHLVLLTGHMRRASAGWRASSWSALVAYRLPIVGHPLGRIHITRNAEARSSRSSASVVRREKPLDLGTLGEPGGLRATGVCEALCDFARTASFRSAVVAADAALHRGLVSPVALRAFADSARGKGAARVRAMAAFADGRAESPGESRLRVLAGEMGLEVTPQYPIYDGEGPPIFRADLRVRRPSADGGGGRGARGPGGAGSGAAGLGGAGSGAAGLGGAGSGAADAREDADLRFRALLLEYDGKGKFSNDGDAASGDAFDYFERQRERDDALTLRGYRVMHVTAKDFLNPGILKRKINDRLDSPV